MTILMTVDGSDRSWNVLPHADALAWGLNVPLHIVRVLHPLLDAGDPVGASQSEALQLLSNRWLVELTQHAVAQGVEAEISVEIVGRHESAEDAIVRVAGGRGVAAIAMHSRGSGRTHHAIAGSTALGVLGKWLAPMLLTGPATRSDARADIYRLMITNDGSTDSDRSVVAFARMFAGVPIGIVLAGFALGSDVPGVEEHLESLVPHFPEPARVSVHAAKAGHGSALVDTILGVAEATKATAIAMGSHGHSTIRHLFAGSTAIGVLRNSPRPVLLVPV